MKKEYRGLFVIHILVLLAFSMAALTGERVVTAIAQGEAVRDRHCIIIDAGHGGVDGGAISCTGALESQINLEIALRLQDLSHLLGYETCMIRQTDISIHIKGETIAQKKVSDLKERVRIVNQTNNSILLSIHQNHFPDGKYSGAQIFYGKSSGGKALADVLQTSFAQTLNPGSRRKPKQANGIYLMEHIQCTGVLIECGFLSNYQEESKLRTEQYQKHLCCVMIAGVSRYLNS